MNCAYFSGLISNIFFYDVRIFQLILFLFELITRYKIKNLGLLMQEPTIEDGCSNSKSIKQYGSSYSLPDLEQHESSYNLLTQWDPGEKPLQPPLFRKAIATKITYFLWIQSEYDLSCMGSSGMSSSLSGRSGRSFSGTGGPGESSWGVSTISVLWTFL